MDQQSLKAKRKEWLSRYIPAEIIGTAAAVLGAWSIYTRTNSYIAATAVGWVGEGIGFYGYFVLLELTSNVKKYSQHGVVKRLALAATEASTNLLVEFLPAELLDNFIIRPFLMYLVPHYIHPYPLGFLVGKLGADILFYALAITGYEARKHWLHR